MIIFLATSKPGIARAIQEASDEANNIKVDLASKRGDHIGPVISKKQYNKIIDLSNPINCNLNIKCYN